MADCFVEKESGAAWIRVQKSDGETIAIRVSSIISIEDHGTDPVTTTVCYDSRVGCTVIGINEITGIVFAEFVKEPKK